MKRWWFGYFATVCMVLGAMSWLTWLTITTHNQKRDADRTAFADETARLALWRMDTQLTALMAREAGRPYIAYLSFYPATGAIHRDLDAIQPGDIIIPSPLLGIEQSEALLHFQFSPKLEITSPQVPLGTFYNAAVPGIVSASQVSEAKRRLQEFNNRVSGNALVEALQSTPAISRETTIARLAFACQNPMLSSRVEKQQLARQNYTQTNVYDSQQKGNDNRKQNAYFNSAWALQQESNNNLAQQIEAAGLVEDSVQVNDATQISQSSALPNATALDAEIMRPLWIGDTLILARRVTIDGANWLQGCWLDWPTVRQQLLDGIQDLLPAANLVANTVNTEWASPSLNHENNLTLATLPVTLIPGTEIPDWVEPPPDFTMTIVLFAWVGIALAVIAGGVILASALQLSERRGTFVSAVTHELRTPLTTFRLYTDLLAGGHVGSEEERQSCITTLQSEADRLGHLVENVMSFARLERQPLPTTALGISALLGDLFPRLSERAARAQLQLDMHISPTASQRAVRGEPHAIERILGNLIDNACKYASSADDRRIHLDVDLRDKEILLTVRDHGPGITPAVAANLFQPFSKSAATAAVTAPGIGLGLALSRRLARQLGGDLSYVANPDGAIFVLSLPLAT